MQGQQSRVSDPIIAPVTKELPVEDLMSRLTSRKFLFAVGTVIALLAHGDVNAAVAVVLGYFGVNVLDK